MIIFINGSINSGKSTVSKILADKLGDTAVLEIDYLRNFIDWMPLEMAIPINLENAMAVIRVFANKGLNVIVPYPLSKNNYNYFLNNLKGVDDIKVFTLSPKLETALANRGSRKLDDWERDRIKHHYAIGIQNPDFGVIIDNSRETPEQTTARILKELTV
jgi:adenylate kinase family enzyme